ncbi:FliM/FliN family flagellar motor switch protein [Thermopirellula anaerolimosa]
MRSLLPDDFPGIVQSIREGAAEIAGAFLRGIDVAVRIQDSAVKILETVELPRVAGPGLQIFLGTGAEGEGAILWTPLPPETQPSWLESPDATGESRLATLAQELSVLLLPADCSGEKLETRFQADLAGTASRWATGEATRILEIPCEITSGEQSFAVCWYFVGPVQSSVAETAGQPSGEDTGAASGTAAVAGTKAATPARSAPAASPVEGRSAHPASQHDRGPAAQKAEPRSVRDLPLITRSLLRIRVPVQVTLAETRRPLSEVLQFAPGVIIQFNKSCDEPLELQINGRTVAVGEAVKVGDKFGLRITKMTPPPERYIRLAPPAKKQPLPSHSS